MWIVSMNVSSVQCVKYMYMSGHQAERLHINSTCILAELASSRGRGRIRVRNKFEVKRTRGLVPL